MMRNLLLTTALLAACEEPQIEEVESTCDADIFSSWDYEIESDSTGLAADEKAMSFSIDIESDDGYTVGLEQNLTLFNDSTENDCRVAIYLSDSRPDLDIVQPLEAESEIQEEDANLGRLLFSANLGHARDIGDEKVVDKISFGDELSENVGDEGVHVTILSCGDSRIDIQYRFMFYECGPDDEYYESHFSSFIGIERAMADEVEVEMEEVD
jgi:hypothetical protein